jgi:XTP/dITP diphosphohydrolase
VHTWLVGTRNRGKLVELLPLLEPYHITAITLDDAGVLHSPAEDDIEVFATFEDNARAKAVYYAACSGLPCLADDSGLCVDALDGAPGVRSRRFARDRGVHARAGISDDALNNEALLEACWDSGHAPPWSASFVCTMALADATASHVASARTSGAILPDAAGSGGFGYDPLFLSHDLQKTFALASLQEKSAISHRARALAALLALLGLAR